MTIDDLRSIGSALLREVTPLRHAPDIGAAIGTGAAGDKTFEIDRIAEALVIRMLEAKGEPLTIISEEAGIVDLQGGGLRVVIDPIDGSKNAVAGIPFFSTSIAVAAGGTLGDVSLAYIINLLTGDEFWAERGGGAYMNGVRLTAQRDDIFSLVAYEAQVPARDVAAIMPLIAASRKTRCFGSTALDLAYVARGAVSVFVSAAASRSFDFAAGMLLAEEAGGIVTDLAGGDIRHLPLGLKRTSPLLVAGNVRLHAAALMLLSRQADV